MTNEQLLARQEAQDGIVFGTDITRFVRGLTDLCKTTDIRLHLGEDECQAHVGEVGLPISLRWDPQTGGIFPVLDHQTWTAATSSGGIDNLIADFKESMEGMKQGQDVLDMLAALMGESNGELREEPMVTSMPMGLTDKDIDALFGKPVPAPTKPVIRPEEHEFGVYGVDF